MVRYHDWMLACSTDGIMPIDAKFAIQESKKIYGDAKAYIWLLFTQLVLILFAMVVNHFRKEKACKRVTHRIAAIVRFVLSTLVAVLIFFYLADIKGKVDDETLAYMSEHDCTTDQSLEDTFTSVSKYLANTQWRWIISLIFLIAVFSLDAV